MHRIALLIAPLLLGGTATAQTVSSPGYDVYVEFLWSKTPSGALARQETRTFALEPGLDPQVCVVVSNARFAITAVDLQAVDAQGSEVTRRTYPDVDGSKRCVSAELPADATPGNWTYKVRVNGLDGVAGERSIDVFKTVDALVKHVAQTMPGLPYVLGRPNYDSSIPPASYNGELIWVMHIKPDGTVSKVDVDTATGIGEVMRPSAVAAGMISLFPPDPKRAADATFRRHLSLRPDN